MCVCVCGRRPVWPCAVLIWQADSNYDRALDADAFKSTMASMDMELSKTPHTTGDTTDNRQMLMYSAQGGTMARAI